jgi:uncharacterized repeat protein (TIGR01451 family)
MRQNLRRLAATATVATVAAALVVVPATSASAAEVAMAISVTADGHGPFTATDIPGGDSSATNGIVRSDDSIVYGVTVNATQGRAIDQTFSVTAPDGSSWASLPDACEPDGSRISGNVLTCLLGDLTNQTTRVPVVLAIDRTTVNGTTIVPTGEVSAANAATKPAAPPRPVTVSAAARFDLAVTTMTPQVTPANGPDGTTPGTRLVYPILLDWKNLVDGAGLLGYEALAGDVSFTDDVSKMFGTSPSTAALFSAGAEAACGINTGQIPGAPGGRGGGTTSVVDSGTITCTQSAPGAPVSVKITGVDSSLSSVPSANVKGGPIVGGSKNYVVSGFISLWVPLPAPGASAVAKNTYTDLVAPSITGQANYAPGGEPTTNNSISITLGNFVGVGGGFRYWGIDPARPSGRTDVSGKHALPYVTPGTLVRPTDSVVNSGLSPWTSATVCIAFHNRYQSLNQTAGTWAQSSATGITGRPQFAAFSTTASTQLRDATCGDGDASWHTDPTTVPGGAAAVGLVRWTFDFPANTTLSFYANLRVADLVPNLTTIRSFASTQPGADQAWTHDRNDADEADGAWADFLNVTSNLARISSTIVDPGTDPATTPDETQYVEQGETVTYALYPTLTNATGGGLPETVTVTDTLPEGMRYVAGSASPAPESVTTRQNGTGAAVDVVTWVFAGVDVNKALPVITFEARVTGSADSESTTNTATISSLRDISGAAFRTTTRAVHILAAGAVDVVDTATRHGVVVGDDLEWTLRYTNRAQSVFDTTDLITSLAFVGDGRGTTTDSATLKSAVEAKPGETVSYTATRPSSIDLDPDDPSNASGGSTTWCSESAFGHSGCPAELSDVTGVRILRTADVAVGASVDHTLVLASDHVADGGVAANSFGLRVSNLSLPVVSNRADVTVHSGSIGHRVWLDSNGDGLQESGESGIAKVDVRLSGTDDLGAQVIRTTASDASGLYRFDGLRPGDYRVAFANPGGGWTTQHVGSDRAIDSDVNASGIAETTLASVKQDTDILSLASDLHVDAGARRSGGHVVPPHRPDIVMPPTGSGSHGPSILAFTGSTIGVGVAGLALALIIAGAGFVLVPRRRRRAAETDA